MMKRTRKYMSFLAVVFLSMFFTSCEVNDDKASGFTAFQEELLDEVNYVRTSPSAYAEKRLRIYYSSGQDNGAYTEIKNTSPMNALELQKELCSAASKYASYLAENNVFGHYENGSPGDRCKAEGYNYYSGENIAAGSSSIYDADSDAERSATGFVLMWIIDKGISGVGHRKNIMNKTHTHLGVGFIHNKNSHYINYAVQDFGREN